MVVAVVVVVAVLAVLAVAIAVSVCCCQDGKVWLLPLFLATTQGSADQLTVERTINREIMTDQQQPLTTATVILC